MNIKLLSFLIFLTLSFSANAQYMNTSSAINLPSNSFNGALSSGMYEGAVGQSLHPDTKNPIYLIVTKRSGGGVQQLQISSSISVLGGEQDKLYFRKIYDNTLEPWIELATRGTNIFKGDQKINGTLYTNEVKVESTKWADFVFEDDYELPSLSEVSSHIQEKKHLPGIPSAQEVKENGVGLAEMNIKLLQKIEELTLYVIKQQDEINELRSLINKQ